MRRLLLRLLVAAFFLNASGLAFGAEQFAAGIAHDIELAQVIGEGEDSGDLIESCKHKCQGHYAQHFTALPSKSPVAPIVSIRCSSSPGLATCAATGATSSLFRPPRAFSL